MAGPEPRRWRLVRASTDAVPESVRRFFMARRRRRHDLVRRRRRVAVVTVGSVAALFAGWLLWGTSLLGVREVRVTGAEIVSPEQVRQAAEVGERTPLLRVRSGEVAARVAALLPVATAQVRREWPDTLVIEVREREPVAAVPAHGSYRLVDAGGVVFHTVPQLPAGLPVVEVTDRAGDGAVRAALTVLAALTPALREQLVTVTVAGPVSIRLELSSGWTVVWGDASQSGFKARVATALLDREGEIIDVSAPEVVSVR